MADLLMSSTSHCLAMFFLIGCISGPVPFFACPVTYHLISQRRNTKSCLRWPWRGLIRQFLSIFLLIVYVCQLRMRQWAARTKVKQVIRFVGAHS
ncbi:hypothetical protein L211DRAFT_679482 [Terfezia boudieri ATCC MYA-4762]|uniref:Uncharacterized protein n=1 Tax=Terfezia boudieri ATCC MYA-4762 TaxID=1051890 RepID=A0A3N4LUJ3_9PEZI|nr:hypothetical protein L211DRAFT_679482 [Terfezia boudieri ATCC MYA-4762]